MPNVDESRVTGHGSRVRLRPQRQANMDPFASLQSVFSFGCPSSWKKAMAELHSAMPIPIPIPIMLAANLFHSSRPITPYLTPPIEFISTLQRELFPPAARTRRNRLVKSPIPQGKNLSAGRSMFPVHLWPLGFVCRVHNRRL